MNTVELQSTDAFAIGSETVVHLPSGLLGFEQFKKYSIQCREGEEPFYWLDAVEETGPSFLTISPFTILPEYSPDIPTADARALGIEIPDDAFLLNIVTLRPHGRSTVNLKGPIVINRFSLRGKQVVLANAADFSLQHPLPTE